MAIDTSINNDTALQILGEIVNLLNNTPVADTPWIGLPPYTDTKTDLLYEIWQALKNGSSAGASTAKNKFLFFSTQTSGNQAAFLPANCMVTSVIARSNSAINYLFNIGTVSNNSLFFSGLFISSLIERTTNPGEFIKNASQIYASFTPDGVGSVTDTFSFLIFYTEISGTGF